MKTVVGLFDDTTQAQRAMRDLESAGFSHNDISLIANNTSGQYDSYASQTNATTNAPGAIGADATAGAAIGGVAGLLMGLGLFVIPGFGPIAAAGWLVSTITGAGIGAVAGGLIGLLVNAGVPEEDAAYYNEGVRRGGTLLAVRAQDAEANRAAQILGDDGAVDIEQRGAQYRQEGFLPTPNTPIVERNTDATPAPSVPVPSNTQTATNLNAANQNEVTLPVIEEQIQVGKREVERGGVRVYSHVTETPVQENVQLREEHVTVDRRPVNRPVGEQELATFKEGSFEVTETAEEAVVAKQARVVEEVVVGKEATQRTETISDTVRRTDVEVEQIPGGHTSRTANYDTYETDFRNHYQTTYGSQGGSYEQYSPAYRYGYELSSNRQYSGQDWNTIEPNIRRDWETRQPGTWDRFKGSVRYAWDRATGAGSGYQTGGTTQDTRGVGERVADAVTGDRIDDKTGRAV